MLPPKLFSIGAAVSFLQTSTSFSTIGTYPAPVVTVTAAEAPNEKAMSERAVSVRLGMKISP